MDPASLETLDEPSRALAAFRLAEAAVGMFDLHEGLRLPEPLASAVPAAAALMAGLPPSDREGRAGGDADVVALLMPGASAGPEIRIAAALARDACAAVVEESPSFETEAVSVLAAIHGVSVVPEHVPDEPSLGMGM